MPVPATTVEGEHITVERNDAGMYQTGADPVFHPAPSFASDDLSFSDIPLPESGKAITLNTEEALGYRKWTIRGEDYYLFEPSLEELELIMQRAVEYDSIPLKERQKPENLRRALSLLLPSLKRLDGDAMGSGRVERLTALAERLRAAGNTQDAEDVSLLTEKVRYNMGSARWRDVTLSEACKTIGATVLWQMFAFLFPVVDPAQELVDAGLADPKPSRTRRRTRTGQ